MPAARNRSRDHHPDTLSDTLAAILDAARSDVAGGRAPDGDALRERARAAVAQARAQARNQETGAIDAVGQRALQQLERVLKVQRARALLARESPPTPASSAPRRAALRTRPTINANMDVRREREGDRYLLAWDAVPAVARWEVRVSERPDARGDYVLRDSLELSATTASVEVPLGDLPLRVHVLGRSRDGRLLRRAVVSALTREGWDDRWQRRASAS